MICKMMVGILQEAWIPWFYRKPFLLPSLPLSPPPSKDQEKCDREGKRKKKYYMPEIVTLGRSKRLVCRMTALFVYDQTGREGSGHGTLALGSDVTGLPHVLLSVPFLSCLVSSVQHLVCTPIPSPSPPRFTHFVTWTVDKAMPIYCPYAPFQCLEAE